MCYLLRNICVPCDRECVSVVVWRYRSLVLSWNITNYWIVNGSDTTHDGSVCGTIFFSGAPELTPVFSGVRIVQSFVISVVFCQPSFVCGPLPCRHCIVCPLSVAFWLPRWHLQTFLNIVNTIVFKRLNFDNFPVWLLVIYCINQNKLNSADSYNSFEYTDTWQFTYRATIFVNLMILVYVPWCRTKGFQPK